MFTSAALHAVPLTVSNALVRQGMDNLGEALAAP